MSRLSRLLASGAAILALSAASLTPLGAHGAAMTRTLRLHGTMYARKAMAAAQVTQVSPDDYRVKITAQGLPVPEMIHAMPRRHAYLAWTIDSTARNAMMEAIPLAYNKTTHVYTGTRVVMVKHVSRIVVTADKSAMQHMPTMPEIVVLTSGGSGM